MPSPTIPWILMVSTRLVTLSYVVLAIYAFIESRELLREDGSGDSNGYNAEGATLYIPLVLCIPANIQIQINGQIFSVDLSEATYECRQMDYLINACASSLIFSIVGGLLYLLIDCMARYGKGSFNMSAANGMGLFFIFILTQAGIGIGALVEQTSYWVDYFQIVIDGLADEDIGINNVESYANKQVLRAASIVAFGTAFFILLDAIAYRCYNDNDKDKECDVVAEAKAQMDLKLRESEPTEEAAQASTGTPVDNSPPSSGHATPSWSLESDSGPSPSGHATPSWSSPSVTSSDQQLV
jgi:hypothetical protein